MRVHSALPALNAPFRKSHPSGTAVSWSVREASRIVVFPEKTGNWGGRHTNLGIGGILKGTGISHTNLTYDPMSDTAGPALLLLLILFSCAPAPETSRDDGLPPGRVYALTEVRPLEFINDGGTYGTLRLELLEDSARIFNPFTSYSRTVAARRADGAQETTDSVYLSYVTEADTVLRATLYTPRQNYTQRYRAVDALPPGGWSMDQVGHTYRLVRDTGQWLVHLANIGGGRGPVSIFQSHMLRVEEGDGRRVTDRTNGWGAIESDRVFTSFRLPGNNNYDDYMRPALAVAGELADGSPALYVLGRDTLNPEPAGVYHLEPYPALLPEAMGEAEMLELLNRSRIEVGELPPEPDSVGIAYQNEQREHDPVLLPEEVPKLDIAFTDEGRYTLFAGDRIVREGRWSLSPDRNFMFFWPDQSEAQGLALISAYNEEFLSVPFPLEVETKEPRGVRLRSYYRPLPEVRFYPITGSEAMR